MNIDLELNFVDIYNRLNQRNWTISSEQILAELIETFRITEFVTSNLKEKTGYERNDNIGLTNPLLWEYGHTLHFWEHIVLKNIGYNNFSTDKYIYNSFKLSRENRFNKKYKLLTPNEILQGYKNVISYINMYISNYNLNKITLYLIRLGQLHLEMHNESFIFTNHLLGFNIFNFNYILRYEDPLEEIQMINVKTGSFSQGVSFASTKFYFDNEAPSHLEIVESFQVSKYCITNYQYLQFVLDNGYKNKKYWCEEGWNFIKNKKLEHPIYWFNINNTWVERIYNKKISLRSNHPIIHISWYEACAYCKWKGVRLLREKEWEYLAKSNNEKNQIEYGHLNYGYDYSNHSTISVLDDQSENSLGIVGLFGNCWEWCQEPLYPYDGFIIDPVYREMSYPHFGSKRICRGGSWAVPKILINSHYRNAQPPECVHQFIGFRVALTTFFMV